MDERITNHPFFKGLQILAKYNDEELSMDAQHDIIYAQFGFIEEDDVSDEDKQALDDLGGWHYSDEDSWAFFT